MGIIDKYVKAIAEKYGLSECDIDVSRVESFVFHPEKLECVVQNPRVFEAPRIVTMFPVKSA